jgi:hypothetical protein
MPSDRSAASIDPKPGFAVCRSCDPPRYVPSGEVLAHLTEHHLSVREIDYAELSDAE